MISVLYVRSDSIYQLLNVDCWDIERDARNFNGNNVIIAHPPCRTWGNLSHLAKPRPDEKELAIIAVNSVRKNGGILEHPIKSRLFSEMQIPPPGSIDEFGGFLLSINQSWFGHRAEKKTYLYFCGITAKQLPLYPISLDAVTHVISSNIKKHTGRFVRNEVTKRENKKAN